MSFHVSAAMHTDTHRAVQFHPCEKPRHEFRLRTFKIIQNLFGGLGQHRPSMSFLRVFLLLLLVSAAAAQTPQCPSDPYLDPSNDPCNALRYIPSNTLTATTLGRLPLLSSLSDTYRWPRDSVGSYCGINSDLLDVPSWYKMDAHNGHW
jgi:hypothetical protein